MSGTMQVAVEVETTKGTSVTVLRVRRIQNNHVFLLDSNDEEVGPFCIAEGHETAGCLLCTPGAVRLSAGSIDLCRRFRDRIGGAK